VNHLSTVKEIAELCFPDAQEVRIFPGHAILELKGVSETSRKVI
jgi:hypothetical protein